MRSSLCKDNFYLIEYSKLSERKLQLKCWFLWYLTKGYEWFGLEISCLISSIDLPRSVDVVLAAMILVAVATSASAAAVPVPVGCSCCNKGQVSTIVAGIGGSAEALLAGVDLAAALVSTFVVVCARSWLAAASASTAATSTFAFAHSGFFAIFNVAFEISSVSFPVNQEGALGVR